MIFQDRHDAGRKLASYLSAYKNRNDVLVLALPRGGVPVAYEVAESLNTPLDVFIVRKLGAIQQEELAMGAIASGGVRVLNEDIIHAWNITPAELEAVTAQEKKELERRERLYRGKRPAPLLRNRTIILVDDGLATGATMRAAVMAIKQQKPAKLVVAVPVAAKQICEEFEEIVDQVICVSTPEPFYAVGLWYRDFSQTSDEEVHQLLEEQII